MDGPRPGRLARPSLLNCTACAAAGEGTGHLTIPCAFPGGGPCPAPKDCCYQRNREPLLPLDIFSTTFLMALLTIIVIDLVLAGDNALVIGLAARNVPAHLQKRVILGHRRPDRDPHRVHAWHRLAAEIPGLMLAGGLLLLPVAYKLMSPPDDAGDDHVTASTNFGAR